VKYTFQLSAAAAAAASAFPWRRLLSESDNKNEKTRSQFSNMPPATAANLVALCGFTITIIIIIITAVESANILFLLPVPSASHRLWNNVLIEGLEERGHNLTVLTVETERSRRNVTYICMSQIYESLNEFHYSANDDVGTALMKQKSSFDIIKENYQLGNFVSRKISKSNGLQRLLSYPKTFKFHAIVFDYSMAQSLLAFVAHFDHPPLISISPQSQPSRFTAASSTPLLPSYIPHHSGTYTTKTLRENLSQRFMNGFIYHTFDWFYAKFVYMKNENRRATKMLGESHEKLMLEQLEQSDLVLINRNFAFDDVLPLPPNVVPVAGMQAQRKNEIQNDVSSARLITDFLLFILIHLW
jgi:glucuronosyltransferase